MNNINVCLLAAVACTYSIQVSANSLEHNLNFVNEDNVFSLHNSSAASHTVTPLELKPILHFNHGIKLAAVCSIIDGGCEDENIFNLDNNAQCRDEGFGTSCGYGYVPDLSQKCPYNDAYFKCRVCSHTCNAGSLAYCSSDQIETGATINDCSETCYQCRAKTCEEGGYNSSINSCQKATSINFNGKTCYTSVTNKSCSDGGYQASIPTNRICSLTSYCGNTCYHSCYQPGCTAGGYLDSIPANHSCSSTSYYGRTCYYSCRDLCPYKGTLASCPVGFSCEYEDCSGKFFKIGCDITNKYYDLDNFWCGGALRCMLP